MWYRMCEFLFFFTKIVFLDPFLGLISCHGLISVFSFITIFEIEYILDKKGIQNANFFSIDLWILLYAFILYWELLIRSQLIVKHFSIHL